MTLRAPALDPTTDLPFVDPIEEDEFAAALVAGLPVTWDDAAKAQARAAAMGMSMRAAIPRGTLPQESDPRQVGWTYLVAADDPQRDDIAAIVRPLAVHRGMADPDRPLVFGGEPPEEWGAWIEANYAYDLQEPPLYVLIVGGPDRVPFHFQATLDVSGAVGRLAFDDLDSLRAYVEKVLRTEAGDVAPARRKAIFFATDRGRPDPTYYSRRFMAEPLAEELTREGVPVTSRTGGAATKEALLELLTTERPGVVYTATHGATYANATQEERERLTGALVCSGPKDPEVPVFAACDLPGHDVPLAEGAVVISFACFSAGTPAVSDFHHWRQRGVRRENAAADFVAALPSALLAHPRGPLAFIGHVDLAWLHAFDDPGRPDIRERHHRRLAVFRYALKTALGSLPVGLALKKMNDRLNQGNHRIATMADAVQRGALPSPEQQRMLVDAWILRNDAQNYIVLGDPATYPHMDDGAP
jgi:hypothetical protein